MPLQYFIARQKVEDRGLEGLQVEIGGGFLLAVVSIVLAGKSRVRFRIFFNDVAGIDQCVALADVARSSIMIQLIRRARSQSCKQHKADGEYQGCP